MADIEKDEAEAILERLSHLKSSMGAMRNEMQELAPLIREADDGIETEELLKNFAETSRQSLGLMETLTQKVRLASTRSGHLGALSDQLERLRVLNLQYRDRFSDLWKASLPIQVNARLQEQGTSRDEAWAKRWGLLARDAEKAIKGLTNKGARLSLTPEQEEALLVLRYSGLSFSEVGRVLSVSPPHVFNRQSEIEMDIAVQLLKDHAQADRIELLSDDESTSTAGRKRMASMDILFSRQLRSMRALRVRAGSTSYRILFRLVDQEDEEKGDETLIPMPTLDQEATRVARQFEKLVPEFLQHINPDVIAVYWMKEARFLFLPGPIALPPTLKEIRVKGTPNLISALSQSAIQETVPS